METSKEYIIKGELREKTGKSIARKIRKAGLIPGTILNKGKSTYINLEPKLLGKAYQTDRTFILDLAGKQEKVFVQEVQVDPITRAALHVDLIYSSHLKTKK